MKARVAEIRWGASSANLSGGQGARRARSHRKGGGTGATLSLKGELVRFVWKMGWHSCCTLQNSSSWDCSSRSSPSMLLTPRLGQRAEGI